MRRAGREIAWYESVWVFVMFDLPVGSRGARRRYARFRKALLTEGFTMLQYSVYARHGRSEAYAAPIKGEVRRQMPPDGQVRVLSVTDRQFAKMEVYFGARRHEGEEPPRQFMLF